MTAGRVIPRPLRVSAGEPLPDEPVEEFDEREPTPDERRDFEDALVEIVADVIVARRSIAA